MAHTQCLIGERTCYIPILCHRHSDIMYMYVSPLTQDGYAGLHYASSGGHADILHLMLTRCSCNVETRTRYNETPLHLACLSGHLSVAKLLVEHGADLQSLDGKNNTTLHLAAASGSCGLVNWITHEMKCDALLNQQNKVSLLIYRALPT